MSESEKRATRPRCATSGTLGRPDQLDHLVEVVERDHVAFEDVGAFLRLAQEEGRAPAHHVAPEVDEQLAGLEQVQHARPLLDDRQEDDAERVLERRVLVQVVEDDLRRLATLDVDDDAHPLPVALVAHVLDPADLLVARQLGDLLDQARLVDLVGDLADHDRLALALPASRSPSAPASRPSRGPCGRPTRSPRGP